MNYKKLAIPVLLSSVFLISGCSNKEDEISKKDSEIVTDETPAATEEVATTDTDEKSEPINDENKAVNVVNTYFEGINEEDLEKIKSVYENEKMLESYEELFKSLDIKSKVISYEVLSQEDTVWEFDVRVQFSSAVETSDYTDNITSYLIKVDSSTGKITYLELVATNEI